jgi:hypothetical protein
MCRNDRKEKGVNFYYYQIFFYYYYQIFLFIFFRLNFVLDSEAQTVLIDVFSPPPPSPQVQKEYILRILLNWFSINPCLRHLESRSNPGPKSKSIFCITKNDKNDNT